MPILEKGERMDERVYRNRQNKKKKGSVNQRGWFCIEAPNWLQPSELFSV